MKTIEIAVGWKRKPMSPCIQLRLFVKSKTKQRNCGTTSPNGTSECQHFLLHNNSTSAYWQEAKQQTWRAAGVFRSPWVISVEALSRANKLPRFLLPYLTTAKPPIYCCFKRHNHFWSEFRRPQQQRQLKRYCSLDYKVNPSMICYSGCFFNMGIGFLMPVNSRRQ